MSAAELGAYLKRPMTPPDSQVLAAIAAGPIDPSRALPLSEVDRLLDPAPIDPEVGWCWLPDGVGYVAVRTPMPAVTGEMIEWWFDWSSNEPIRYQIWHPRAHFDNSIERPSGRPRAKKHWDTVHHPVEDVGTGTAHARIAFRAPTAMGMSTDSLDDPAIAEIVCGYAGDDTRHAQHTPMFHVVLNDPGGGVVMRSRFWLGAALRPYGPLGPLGAPLMNNRRVRRALLPKRVPQALANHCAEEYANLAALLPELYERFGPRSA